MLRYVKFGAKWTWDKVISHSWLLTVLGALLLAVAGVVTNVTAAAVFRPLCGDAAFCMPGLRVFLFTTTEGWMIVAGLIFSAAGSLISFKEREEVENLKSLLTESRQEHHDLRGLYEELGKEVSNRAINTSQVFSLMLRELVSDLGFGVNHRISLYKVGQGKFFILGRYAENSDYNEVHRQYYDRGQGILEQAWRNGWAEAEIRFNPEGGTKQLKKYCEFQQLRFGVPPKVAVGFRMKSRTYKSLALRDPKLGHPVAIVCLESTDKDGLNHVGREEVQGRFGQLIILMEALEHHIASLDNALNEGL
jgi:hypothetical protein